MTDTSADSGTAQIAGGVDDDAARKHAAAEIRRQRSGWVVIWVARTSRYNAWPLFRAPRGTALTAKTPDELTIKMNQVEQATQARDPDHGDRVAP